MLDSRRAAQEAARAYQTHDYRAFLTHAREAERLRPAHGGAIYNLACAYALTGDTAAALAMLDRFAGLGYAADVAADSDLAALRSTQGFQHVRQRLARNEAPLERSTVAFSLPERDLLTEGIAYDPQEKAFYLGSVHHRKIVRVDRRGRIGDFVPEGRDSLWAPLGMKVDPVRRALWVATAVMPQMAGFVPSDSGRSGIFRYDLASGRLTGRFLLPADDAFHVLGDLTIDRAGNVYAADSRSPAIYRVRASGDTIQRFVSSPLLLAAQGLVLTPDERTMYVADYSRGILRIDMASGAMSLLPTRDSVLALGIDGLYLIGGRLVGIQNGVIPHRVVRLTLSPAGDSVTAGEVLERAHPRYAEPTLGVVVGHDLYYVANSQWERFGEDGHVADPAVLLPPTVLRLRL
ncbi:MAG TPA: SMP-30/gluconolactonase/LRE family protein [Gemmatimonadales bacterium]|nr:SMP-30/gluconolactonase/LRE family protein [Gemmatimonadales bacterium]